MLPGNLKRIGYLAKPHGIDGTMILRIEGEFEEELTEREFLFVSIDKTNIPFLVEEVRVAGDMAYVRFADYSSEDKIQFLKSREVRISSDYEPGKLPDPGFLEGFNFTDITSGKEGRILSFEENENNPLFHVISENQEYLIPVNEDFIVFIDNNNNLINLVLPEGLFDLED